MQGLSLESLKKHKALIPLYVCVGIGCAGAVFYLGRLATRNPDVSWNKKSNPEPWEEYRAKQYKGYGFYTPYGGTASEFLPRGYAVGIIRPAPAAQIPAGLVGGMPAGRATGIFYSPIRDYSKEESPAPKY